jgi:hypothetical protein
MNNKYTTLVDKKAAKKKELSILKQQAAAAAQNLQEDLKCMENPALFMGLGSPRPLHVWVPKARLYCSRQWN